MPYPPEAPSVQRGLHTQLGCMIKRAIPGQNAAISDMLGPSVDPTPRGHRSYLLMDVGLF